MKKFVVSIVCLAFFVVNTGFVVNLHYCMDKFHSWQFGATDNDKCGECGMDKGTNACCHDEIKLVKLEQDVLKSNTVITEAVSLPFVLSFISAYYLPPHVDQDANISALDYSPPLPDKHKSYIENRVFRI